MNKHFNAGEKMNAMTLKNGGLKPIFEAIEDEIIRATNKFPSNKHMLPALNEEVGELNKAIMEHAVEDESLSRRENVHVDDRNRLERMNQDVFMEAVQVACMAIRLMSEGDSGFPYRPIYQVGPVK